MVVVVVVVVVWLVVKFFEVKKKVFSKTPYGFALRRLFVLPGRNNIALEAQVVDIEFGIDCFLAVLAAGGQLSS